MTASTPKTATGPIVFLHGGGVDHRWWHPQTTALKNEFEVHAPDLPGHGSKANQPYRTESGIAALKAYFDENISEPAILVGISLGGYLAIGFSERYPELTRGLILCGSSANFTGISSLAFRFTGIFLRIKGKDWLNEVQHKSFKKRITPEILEPAIEGGLFLDGAISAFAQVAGKNYHKTLESYTEPVLLLNGENDEPNVASQQKLLDRLKNGSLRVLENAGHFANLEQPKAFTDEVRKFASGIA